MTLAPVQSPIVPVTRRPSYVGALGLGLALVAAVLPGCSDAPEPGARGTELNVLLHAVDILPTIAWVANVSLPVPPTSAPELHGLTAAHICAGTALTRRHLCSKLPLPT